jgi:hypothetical protein
MNKDNKLDVLVKDLFRLGDYSNWAPPKQTENIQWFTKQNKKFDDGEAVAKRLEELISLGANIQDKVYLISNVNRVEPVIVALKHGGNPNLPGKNGILPCDRAIDRGRTKIAEAIINSDKFNFISNLDANVLFLAINNGRYKLATQIAEKKPELLGIKNSSNNSIIYCLSEYLSKGNKVNSKVFSFLDITLKYYEDNNIDVFVAESKNNKTIANNSIEIATFITEKQALKLNSLLPKKENNDRKDYSKIKL